MLVNTNATNNLKTTYMRKNLLVPIILALFAVGCKGDNGEIDDQEPVVTPTAITQVTATIDCSTRASALIGADDEASMFWSSGDKIAVTNLTKSANFTIKRGLGSVTGEFAGTLDVAKGPLYVLYPASSAALTDGKLSMTIPVEQSYAPARGTNLGDKILLAGSAAEGTEFTVRPAAAMVVFDITLPQERTINAVTMTSEDVAIAGKGLINLESGVVADTDSKTLTLNYTSPSQGKSADGWATIAAVDFKSATGKVTYAVLTDEGVYTFCYKPDQKFEAGQVYTVKLSVEDFVQVTDLEKIKQGEYYYNLGSATPEPEPDPAPEVDPKLNVRAVRVTDSTIAIGWTITEANIPYIDQIIPNPSANYATDITKQYKVALYRDEACTDLVVSVSPVQKSLADNKDLFNATTCPPRFVFSGLEPATSYYAKVTNITDNYSNTKPVQVTTKAPVADKNNIVTANAKAGDMIVYENFAGLVYAGEGGARAAGISRTDRNKLTSFDGADVKGEITASNSGYYLVDGGTEIGLFNTLGGLIDEMGVQNWGYIGSIPGSICARSGFLKIGTSNNRSLVCTPVLNAIPKGKLATLKVVFNAAPYGSNSDLTVEKYDAERYMAVKALTGVTMASDNLVSYSDVADEQQLTLQGNYVSDWKEYSVTLSGVPSGASIALGGALDAATTNRMFLDDIRVFITALEDAPTEPIATGKITYSDGTPAAGVSVSDGYTVVQTAADGTYTIEHPHQDAWYIYYSVPADCNVEVNQYGQPAFFTKYSKTKSVYNFTLEKLPGGKETQFSLFCLADPQCHGSKRSPQVKADTYRFDNESVPAIKAHAQTKSAPCYGVTLGDVVYSEGSRNSTSYMDDMRGYMAKDKIGMPIFQTMGNHDYTYFYSSKPISADETSSTYNIKAQRAFEDVFGPINYSWNRGDAHIVCMRNMQWSSNTDAGKYTSPTFTSEQISWLRQDLSFVPKDKLVIFCVHVPLVNSSRTGVQDVISLLKQYKEAHIMSGHTHYMRNEPTRSGGIYEHVHAAVCGNWWWSNINGDGCPNGYGVYDIDGNTIKNWYYMGVNPGMNDRDYQIRLYRGDLICGGPKTYFNLQHGNNVIIANVFNADKNWKVKIYEDETSYDMIAIGEKKYSPGASNSIGTTSPVLVPTDSGQDWWAIGYHIGVVGRSGTSGSYHSNCFHMYKHTLRNPNAKIRVEATDCFGRTYTATDILSNTASGGYNSAIYTNVPWNY